jgi:hypothetical protein
MNNLNAVFARIADETPSLYPQSFVAIAKDVFKVGCIYSPIARELSEEELTTMYAKALGDQFTVMPETIEFHSHIGERNVITAFVRANTISKPFDEKEVRASMRCLSKNVFIDDEDTIWKATGGDNPRLVQSKQEDFAAILNERINSQQNVVMATCVSTDLNAHDTENGDVVLYFSPASYDLDIGYAFKYRDRFQVLSYKTKEFEEIKSENIVRSAVINMDNKHSVFNPKYKTGAAMLDDIAMTNGEFTKPLRNKYQEYMKFLYNGTDYFKKLTDLLTLREKVGTNLPVSTIR